MAGISRYAFHGWIAIDNQNFAERLPKAIHNKPVVYAVFHLSDGWLYIGSSIHLRRRWLAGGSSPAARVEALVQWQSRPSTLVWLYAALMCAGAYV